MIGQRARVSSRRPEKTEFKHPYHKISAPNLVTHRNFVWPHGLALGDEFGRLPIFSRRAVICMVRNLPALMRASMASSPTFYLYDIDAPLKPFVTTHDTSSGTAAPFMRPSTSSPDALALAQWSGAIGLLHSADTSMHADGAGHILD